MKKLIGIGLCLQALLFQIFLVTRAKFLYGVLRIVFFAFVALLLAALVRRLKREPVLIVLLLLIVLVRVPFYLHSDGLVTTSDNALDALQAVEMRDSHTAPFFLLGMLKHIGTIKYLWIAFIGDLGGSSYLFGVLVQLALFLGLLFALENLLRDRVPRPALLLGLFLVQFAFMEVVFDYSLWIRGAPYLEMLLFSVVGLGLIDWTFRDKTAVALGIYLVFFAVYIHPLASVLAGSAAVVILIFAFVRKKAVPAVLLLAGGAAAALGHWLYYLKFVPLPVSQGTWEQVNLLPLSRVTWGYLGQFAATVAESFRNLFSFEYSYLAPLYLPRSSRAVLNVLNGAAAWAALAAVLVALFVLGRRLVRLASRRERLDDPDWLPLFFFIALGAVLAKTFLFSPPHTEPRHCFDWAFLVMLAVAVALGAWIGRRPLLSWRSGAVLVLAAALTAPHYETYLRNVLHKASSYRDVLTLLERSGVRTVSTDFIIAYPITYLSGRMIEATDDTGPLTIELFYPALRARIKAMPDDRKAFLFFSDDYPTRPWHKKASSRIRADIENRLRLAGIPFTAEEVSDYVIIIPEPARGQRPGPAPGRR